MDRESKSHPVNPSKETPARKVSVLPLTRDSMNKVKCNSCPDAKWRNENARARIIPDRILVFMVLLFLSRGWSAPKVRQCFCCDSGRTLSPAGTNAWLVLVVSIILGWSGFVPVLLPKEGIPEIRVRAFFLLPESGHAGRMHLHWMPPGNRNCLSGLFYRVTTMRLVS